MSLAHPYALLLIPAAVAVLIFLQLLRARRREVLAGSLMIWRKVAAQIHAPRRRRIVLDRTFWLQVAVLSAIVLALSDPSLTLTQNPGRNLVVMLDNDTTARARDTQDQPLWRFIVDRAKQHLAELNAADRVALCLSCPDPRRVDGSGGLNPQEAIKALENFGPALHPTPAAQAWLFARETGRTFGSNEGSSASVLVLSTRAAPVSANDSRHARWEVVGPGGACRNVALCEFGSTVLTNDSQDGSDVEVFVQIRNFSSEVVKGSVLLESLKQEPASRKEEAREIPPKGMVGITFRLASRREAAEQHGGRIALPVLRISWRSPSGADALPEDDLVIVSPRNVGKPRIRMHGQAEPLRILYQTAEKADFLEPIKDDECDLEIHVEEMPGGVSGKAKAVLLLAPLSAFGPFEVGDELLDHPLARRGTDDPLITGFIDREEGLEFRIEKARTLKQIGDWRPLILDKENHVLAARFELQDGRPGFVCAFVPGVGKGWREEQDLGLALSTFLLRILREAQGAGEPYAVTRAGDIERKRGQALPLDWRPSIDNKTVQDQTEGAGVLDAEASALAFGQPSSEALKQTAILPVVQPVRHPLWPYLVLLALLLLLLEERSEGTPRRTSLSASIDPIRSGQSA